MDCCAETGTPPGIRRVHTSFKIEPEIGNNLKPMRFKYFFQREECRIKAMLLETHARRPSRRVSRFNTDRNLSLDARPVVLAAPQPTAFRFVFKDTCSTARKVLIERRKTGDSADLTLHIEPAIFPNFIPRHVKIKYGLEPFIHGATRRAKAENSRIVSLTQRHNPVLS